MTFVLAAVMGVVVVMVVAAMAGIARLPRMDAYVPPGDVVLGDETVEKCRARARAAVEWERNH